jgi:hypothetical protein
MIRSTQPGKQLRAQRPTRRNALAGTLLPLLGKLNYLMYRIPLIGESLVRGQSRMAARIAFHMPILGGKRSSTLEGVKSEWLKFLSLAGIQPPIPASPKREPLQPGVS